MVAAAGDADPRDCTMADVFEAMPRRRAGKATLSSLHAPYALTVALPCVLHRVV